MNRVWLNAVLFCCGLLVVLAVAEGGLRLFWPQPLTRPFSASGLDPHTLHRPHVRAVDRVALQDGGHLSPLVQTNNLGLRMDHDLSAEASKPRVLILGDSFVFGWGVALEASFFHHLQSRLPALELINGGMGGGSTGHIQENLEKLVPPLAPCAVVYFMNPDDILDNLNTHADYRVVTTQEGPEGEVIITPVRRYGPLKRFLLAYTPYAWLNRTSHLFVLLKHNLARASGRSFSAPVGEGQDMAAAVMANPAWPVAVTVAMTRRLAVAAGDRPLLVVWIPSWRALFSPEDPFVAVEAQLKAALSRQEAFAFFDPTASLGEKVAAAGHGMLDIFYTDGQPVGHFTPLGHALFADSLGMDGVIMGRCGAVGQGGRPRPGGLPGGLGRLLPRPMES